ncbi:ATP-binding protein [Peribacillus sp. SCS-37]|uniref:ATP-binding protein n=1 Tax=Paraperibacillus esterisolvens TaxID=3115296 RepID=UPI003905D981
MNFMGQLVLIIISVAFTLYQTIFHHKAFFTLDFFAFTVIAWLAGWQYDRSRLQYKKARENEEGYKILLDSLPRTVVIHHNEKILYANQAAARMIGAKSRDDLIGSCLLDWVVPDSKNKLAYRVKQINKENKCMDTYEYKLKRLDGTMFYFEASSIGITFAYKKAILTIGKDVTERKEETDRLLQKSEKLALLGQMAAGIAHEIRNPLTSIKGFIQLFKNNHLKEEYVDIVLSELERINSIVGEFLVLAKPTASVLAEQDVKLLVKDVVTLINTQSILNNVQIFVELESDLPKISCEEKQLKQVFLNLLKNSIEAMPDGGNIDVKVTKLDGDFISINIIDQGIGIPQERIATLGEPFYTTKEKGTGLGLMTCFKIIEAHNGELKIDSVVNQGTTIEVILPALSSSYLEHQPNKI